LGNSNYTTDYVIAANGKEYALMIDDPAKAAAFNRRAIARWVNSRLGRSN